MDRVDTIERPHELELEGGAPASERATRPEPRSPREGVSVAEDQTSSAAINARAPRRFAGFTYPQLIAGLLVVAAAIWGMWATSKILALQDRRVVSVRLAAIVNDFVTAEARSGTPPELLGARTKAFMTALDSVLKARAAHGEVVLVGEAVVASSVPDVTTQVVADLSKLVKFATPASVPPAIGAPSSSLPAPSPVVPTADAPLSSNPDAPPADSAANPFGPASSRPQLAPLP